MSYQPFPASGPYAASSQPTAPPAKKGKGLLVLGLLVFVLGIGGAIVTFILQNGQHEDSVKNLARAVPGFDNTLQFDKAGTFNIYYEYAGTVTTNVSGKATSIPLSGPTVPPSMDATLTDKSGKKVNLASIDSAAKYDAAGYKGVAFKTAEIKTPGQFTLSIVPKDAKNATFDLAIGKTAIEDPSLLLPILFGAGGLLIGGLLIIAGSRKPKMSTVPVANASFAPGAAAFGGYQQPGYQQPEQQQPTYGAQPGFQQQPGYPPATAPFGGQPTYQQPSQPSYDQPTYQQPTQPQYGGQPAQPQYGGQPTYQQPAQPTYEQPTYQQPPYEQQPPYGQPPTQPYVAPPDPNQPPAAPPSGSGWGAPPAPPAR